MSRDGIQARIKYLRIIELQECLEKLGLRKSGKKADQQQRLLSLFPDSEALVNAGHVPRDQERVDHCKRVIEEVYSRMMGKGHVDPAPQTQPHHMHSGSAEAQQRQGNIAGPGPSSTALNAAGPPSAALNAVAIAAARTAARQNSTMRCLCGTCDSRQGSQMVQCLGEACGVWQHAACAMHVPVAPLGKRLHASFFCEACRGARADPFWEVVANDIMPSALLRKTGKQVLAGTSYVNQQSIERTFVLQPAQQDLIKRRSTEYRLQVVCIQLDDPVQFRWHWPMLSDLRVNGVQYRVFSRSSNTKLGQNQRDEAANIGVMCSSAKNKVLLLCGDNRPFVMGIQIVRRRSLVEVKRMMLPPLSLKDAVQRIKDEFHEDEDVVTVNTVLSLKDPLTGARIKTPVRFTGTGGLVSFDVDAFLSVAERTRKWQCPHSMANSSVQNLQVDRYTEGILEALEATPEVMEVEISPTGQWRPAGSAGAFLDVGQPFDRTLYNLRGAGGGGGSAAAAREARAGGVMIKQEAGMPQQLNGHPGPAADSDSEEEDEEEELRLAGRAVQQAAEAARRKRAPSPDVIEIMDSDEEGPPSHPAKRQTTLTVGASSAIPAAAAAVPLRPGMAGSSLKATSEVTSGALRSPASSNGGLRFTLRHPMHGGRLAGSTILAAAAAAELAAASGLSEWRSSGVPSRGFNVRAGTPETAAGVMRGRTSQQSSGETRALPSSLNPFSAPAAAVQADASSARAGPSSDATLHQRRQADSEAAGIADFLNARQLPFDMRLSAYERDRFQQYFPRGSHPGGPGPGAEASYALPPHAAQHQLHHYPHPPSPYLTHLRQQPLSTVPGAYAYPAGDHPRQGAPPLLPHQAAAAGLSIPTHAHRNSPATSSGAVNDRGSGERAVEAQRAGSYPSSTSQGRAAVRPLAGAGSYPSSTSQRQPAAGGQALHSWQPEMAQDMRDPTAVFHAAMLAHQASSGQMQHLASRTTADAPWQQSTRTLSPNAANASGWQQVQGGFLATGSRRTSEELSVGRTAVGSADASGWQQLQGGALVSDSRRASEELSMGRTAAGSADALGWQQMQRGSRRASEEVSVGREAGYSAAFEFMAARTSSANERGASGSGGSSGAGGGPRPGAAAAVAGRSSDGMEAAAMGQGSPDIDLIELLDSD